MCILIKDDIVPIDETCTRVARVRGWRQTLEPKGFKLSKTKTEYLDCKSNCATHKDGVEMRLDGRVIRNNFFREFFKYLGCLIVMTSHIVLVWNGKMEARL